MKDMYVFICLVLMSSGGGILYFFDHAQHPLIAVLAIFMLGLGAFLLAFRGKDADAVGRAADSIKGWW